MNKLIHDAAPVETTNQARQGETSGHMRWVLLASLALAIVIVGIATFGFHYH